VNVQITLSPEALATAKKLEAMPGALPAAIAAGVDKGNEYAIAKIQREHLTGKGPFPPAEHRLGVRTNRLRSSLTRTPAVIAGQVISSSIGTNVKYAAIHEFGGVIHKPARSAKVRHRITASGALMRNLKHSNLAMFAKKKHTRAREINVMIPAHDITMPERAPIRTGLAASGDIYKKAIGRAINDAWNKFSTAT
jgi:hypothetical protein